MKSETETLILQPTQEEVDLITNYSKYADIFEAPTQAHDAVIRAVIAAVVNPNVFIQNGGQKLSLDVWTLLLSPSGLGRNTLVSMMRRLLRKADIGGLLRNNSWGSAQGLYQDLAEEPNAFFVWEELAANLKILSQARFANAKEWLTDRYDNFEIPSAITYRRAGKSNDTPPIEFKQGPRICTLATSSHEWFTGALSEADSLGGFIPRWLIVDLPKNDRCIPTPEKPDESMVDSMVEVLRRARKLQGEVNMRRIQADYEVWYREAKERFDGQEQHQLATAFWNRHRVHLLKLAAIYEISQSVSLEVSSGALERAITAARDAENTIFHLLSSGFSKEGAAVEKMYDLILRAGEHGLPKSTVTRTFGSTPEFVREPRLRTLIDGERVCKFVRTTSGRPAEDLVADKFVDQYVALHPDAIRKDSRG